jgi:molybdate transport system substrate-binding protein
MKRILNLLWIVGCILILISCSNEETNQVSKTSEVELTISAAASLTDVLNELQSMYKEENSDVKLFFNYGGSGTLQSQILQGAPVDLFISADESKFKELMEANLIDSENAMNLVGNEIVLVAAKGGSVTLKGFEDLRELETNSIAIGTPETVPAGAYAKQTLENLHIWSDIKSKVVLAKDVRQVLTYVETGNVEAGVVYKTDALSSDKVEIIEIAEPTTHERIIYPAGVINKSNHKQEANDFYQFLQSEEAMSVFEKYGFLQLGE